MGVRKKLSSKQIDKYLNRKMYQQFQTCTICPKLGSF